MVDASTSMRIFSSMVTETPMRPSNSIMVVTSCRCGTFDTVTGPSDSRQPARMGSVAFLAPDMRISPSSGIPPCICSLSTALARIFFGREYLQREFVDLVAHGRPQGRVNQLVPLHGALSGECRGHHHRLEMHVILAGDRRIGSAYAGLNQSRYLLWVHDSPGLVRRCAPIPRRFAPS